MTYKKCSARFSTYHSGKHRNPDQRSSTLTKWGGAALTRALCRRCHPRGASGRFSLQRHPCLRRRSRHSAAAARSLRDEQHVLVRTGTPPPHASSSARTGRSGAAPCPAWDAATAGNEGMGKRPPISPSSRKPLCFRNTASKYQRGSQRCPRRFTTTTTYDEETGRASSAAAAGGTAGGAAVGAARTEVAPIRIKLRPVSAWFRFDHVAESPSLRVFPSRRTNRSSVGTGPRRGSRCLATTRVVRLGAKAVRACCWKKSNSHRLSCL